MPANFEINKLKANEYCFLTLAAGLSLQKDDIVILKKDLADRTLKELGDKISLYDAMKFDFVDGDVNTGTEAITESAHGMANGQPVELRTTGVLPAGLALKTVYYVVSSLTNSFKLSLTSGGSAVNITAAAGGGTHTVHKLAAKLKNSNFEIVRA